MAETMDRRDECGRVLRRILELLAFSADVSVSEAQGALAVSLRTPEPGRLIGRKGYYLQNLEALLNRIMRKMEPGCPWVEIEIEGYQKKGRRGGREGGEQELLLQKMAADAAKEVKRWGEPRTIGPFNARERRQIHMALRGDASLVTESLPEDERGRKSIVIRPAAGGRSDADRPTA